VLQAATPIYAHLGWSSFTFKYFTRCLQRPGKERSGKHVGFKLEEAGGGACGTLKSMPHEKPFIRFSVFEFIEI